MAAKGTPEYKAAARARAAKTAGQRKQYASEIKKAGYGDGPGKKATVGGLRTFADRATGRRAITPLAPLGKAEKATGASRDR
jgi:hypothetical protein